MKEIDVNNYYGAGAKEQLSRQDYDNEMERLTAEKKANEKYKADDLIMKDRAVKEEIKKKFEEESRNKETAARKERIHAEVMREVRENAAQREAMKKREEAIENFDKLTTEEKVLILNDEDDMQPYFESMVVSTYEDYKKNLKADLNKMSSIYSDKVTQQDLTNSNVFFRFYFKNLQAAEKAYIVAMGKYKNNDNEYLDSMIVSNFVYKNRSVADIVREEVGDRIKDEKTLKEYEKLYVVNVIKDIYSEVELEVDVKLHKLKEQGLKDPEEIKKKTAELEAEAFEQKFKDIQYVSFAALKNKKGELEIIRPAEDYIKEGWFSSRKNWLSQHPEKKEKEYKKDDLAFQLKLVKGMAGMVANERKLSASVYSEENKDRIPDSITRMRYELREFRSAFAMQAKELDYHYPELQRFNENMAILCDHDAGDLRWLMRSKPHIAKLIDVIVNGPLTNPIEGMTQKQVYDAMKNEDEGALSAYMSFVDNVVSMVSVEYMRQQYELSGFDPKYEAQITDKMKDIYISVSNLKDHDYSVFDKYCRKSIAPMLSDKTKESVLSDAEIINSEQHALFNGWSVKESFIFAMVGNVYNKARELYYQDKAHYTRTYDEISDMNNDLQWGKKVTTAIEKRAFLKKFDNFIRNNIQDKALVGAIEGYQLEYDFVRENFDNGYKNAVLKELNDLKGNTAELAKAMIKMEKTTLQSEDPLNESIMKEFIGELGKEEKKDLQKALHYERMGEMIARAESVSKHTDEIYKRDELASFKNYSTIRNNILAQIGRLESKNDGVAAADKLSGMFDEPLPENEKEAIKQDYTKKNIDSKSFKIGNEVVHDWSYYQMKMAENIDNNKTNHGFKVVKAPEGGYNIRYDKEIIEIRKDVMEKADAQIEDIRVEYAKIKTTFNMYLSEMMEKGYNKVTGKKYWFTALATMNEYSAADDWIRGLNDVLKYIEEPLADAKKVKGTDDEKKGEYEFIKGVWDFTQNSLKVLTPENYPDVDFYVKNDKLKEQVEVSKVLWENKKAGNKWEPVVSGKLKEKIENDKKDPNYGYYKALSTEQSRKVLDYDKGYDKDGYILLKPSKILEMCDKYFGALVAIDGNDVSKASVEYQNFYYALKDLKNNFKAKEVSQEDGSNVTLDCLHDLNLAIKNYLNSKDTSKNATLRRNVAIELDKNYLHTQSAYDVTDQIDEMDKWVKKNDDVKDAIDNLPDEAKAKRQARIEAEKKAVEDAKKAREAEEDRKAKYSTDKEKIIDRINEIKKQLKKLDDEIADAKHQVEVSTGNKRWAENNGKDTSHHVDLIKKSNAKIEANTKLKKPLEAELAKLNKQLEELKKANEKAEKLNEAKIAELEKPRFKRQEVLDQMKANGGKAALKKRVKKADKKEDKKVDNKKKAEDKKKVEEKKIVENHPEDIININEPENNININEPENIINNNQPENNKINGNNKINDDNVIKENVIKENDIIGGDKKVNDKKPVKKQGKVGKEKLPVSYSSYIILHTGDNMGKDNKKKIENLSKVMAATALSANKKKFSVSMIHDYAEVMKENFNLSGIKEDKLNEYLASAKSGRNALYNITDDMYKVTDINAFCDDMKILADKMRSSKGRSDEYKDMARRIAKVADIKNQAYDSDEEMQRAVNYGAFLVTFTVGKYMKGKKSVRTFEGGRARFDNALDALAIVSKYAPNSGERIKKLTDRIDKVRNDKEHKIDLSKYGAQRAANANKPPVAKK